LHKFHLAPLSGIVASVNFKNGVATEAQILLEIDDRDAGGQNQPGTGATIHWVLHSMSCPQHLCTYLKEKWGYSWAVVELDSDVTKTEVERVFAINTNCLIRIGGCTKIEAILPRVFTKP
jgi:hypothetical protein